MLDVSRSSMAYPCSHRSTCLRVSTGHVCAAGAVVVVPVVVAGGRHPVTIAAHAAIRIFFIVSGSVVSRHRFATRRAELPSLFGLRAARRTVQHPKILATMRAEVQVATLRQVTAAKATPFRRLR